MSGAPDGAAVTREIAGIVLERRAPRAWWWAFGIGLVLLAVLAAAVTWLFARGVGVWGVNVPVAWGFAITSFVWWIGIGHAGTLISAILYLMRRTWRDPINRFAEAMTLVAVACAALMPLLHLGRPWLFYWLLPYPDTMGLWPQFRSSLVWDVFAVATYATVSFLFWYLGLIPDLATLRDRAPKRWIARAYGVLALGWRNDARHWRLHRTCYLLLAGLATPLVVSVHSVVSTDFAIAQTPGWHATVFPPFFVAGALFSGLAMVLTLAIPLRAIYRLQHLITERHLEVLARLMLATGLLVAYGYLAEHFAAWYSGNVFERRSAWLRITGEHAAGFWTMIACNVLLPQVLWWPAARRSPALLLAVALLVNVGMWTERYVIVVGSLRNDFLPAAWGGFTATIWDWATLLGSFGLFLVLFALFVRFLPLVSMAELRRASVPEA